MFSNKYMYKNSLNELSKESTARNCKAFGYMDGYLDEEIYSSIFEYNDNNNANYEKGYIEGVNARLKEDSDVLLMQKSEHIIKLAMYDGENGIAPRRISRNYKDMYARNYYKARCANSEMINAYMYETEILDDSEEQVYTCGYMDGYFDEYVYGDASYSEDLAYLYEIGYHEGELNRNANLARANLEKLKWLVSLSINDSLNGIHNRSLSIDARSVYNSHYQFLDDDVMGDEGVLDNKLSDEEYFRFRHKKCCK